MTHTREALEAMTRENLSGILKGMKLTARGKDTTLINRILEHQDKPPSPDSELSEQNDPDGFPHEPRHGREPQAPAENLRRHFVAHRSRHSSFSGELHQPDDLFADTDALDLPFRARELPRPHTLCQPRSGQKDSRIRVDPLDLSLSKFLSESTRLLLLLMKSPAHHDVAVEYAEYIQYVISRSIDYSVLAFGNNFRNRVKFERSSLADSDCRR